MTDERTDNELNPISNVGDLRRLIEDCPDDVLVRLHFGVDLAIAESGFDDDDGALLLFADSDGGVSPVSTVWLRAQEADA